MNGSGQNLWPNQSNGQILDQNARPIDPIGAEFDYIDEVETLGLNAVEADIEEVMATSEDWWPADCGHYEPLFIPDGVARRQYVPDQRWPRRRVRRYTMLRTPQQPGHGHQPRSETHLSSTQICI